ncbi:MAG: CotH kinase family protein, partial [Lachnospiraceae bacterium]|nr:CotH kinase family protein [Lachnospiraceae bacterium]
LEEYSKTAAKILVDNNVVSPSEQQDLEDYLTWHMSWLSSGIIEYEEHTFDISSYIDLPEQVDGGLLFELDAFYDEPSKFMVKNQPIQIRGPKYIGSNGEIMGYAIDFVTAFYNAAYLSEDFYTLFQGTATHYTQLFDIDSLAKYFIMTEVFFNEDVGLKSTYFYKDLGTLAQMGPVWDMDYSSGGQGVSAEVYDQWQTVFYSNYSQVDQWYKGLIRDPYFLSKALEVWDTYRETILDIIAEDGSIEQAHDYIYDSALANDKVWPPDIDSDPHTISTYGFIAGYDTFKTWMTHHLHWLDAQFTTLEHLTASVGAFDSGNGVTMTRDGLTVHVAAEEGTTAKFYFNGILQAEIPVTGGAVSWTASKDQQTATSDVIQVRIYREDGSQVGSDFVDFR